MKPLIYSALILFLLPALVYAQMEHRRFGGAVAKIEELEKLKLVEALNLDEETTLKFFSRRAEHRDRMKKLLQSSDDKLADMEAALKQSSQKKDEEFQKLLKEYLSIEEKIAQERTQFLTSLSDILPNEKIITFIVFEKKFREEVREILMRERGKRRR
jgi:HD superfamily phosphohydrolase